MLSFGRFFTRTFRRILHRNEKKLSKGNSSVSIAGEVGRREDINGLWLFPCPVSSRALQLICVGSIITGPRTRTHHDICIYLSRNALTSYTVRQYYTNKCTEHSQEEFNKAAHETFLNQKSNQCPFTRWSWFSQQASLPPNINRDNNFSFSTRHRNSSTTSISLYLSAHKCLQ